MKPFITVTRNNNGSWSERRFFNLFEVKRYDKVKSMLMDVLFVRQQRRLPYTGESMLIPLSLIINEQHHRTTQRNPAVHQGQPG